MYCIGLLVIAWILLIIFSKFSNECGQSLYLTYDLFLLATTVYMSFLGYRSLNEIIQTEYRNCQQNIDPNALQVHLDELRERKYSYFILLSSVVMSSVLEIFTDAKKYDFGSAPVCTQVLVGRGAVYLFFFTLAETVAKLLPIGAIYYVFYWKKRDILLIHSVVDKRPSEHFDSMRSDMVSDALEYGTPRDLKEELYPNEDSFEDPNDDWDARKGHHRLN